jgi:hypothetical protein
MGLIEMFVDLFLKTQAQQMQLVQTSLEMIIYTNTMYKIWFHLLVVIGAILLVLECSFAISTASVRLAAILRRFGLVLTSHKVIEKILYLFYFSSNYDIISIKKD